MDTNDLVAYNQMKKAKKTDTSTKPVNALNSESVVAWTTPLNLVVVQPYRQERTSNVHFAFDTYVALIRRL